MDLKKMQNISEVFIDKFKDAATELIRNEVRNTDEDNIKTIIMFTARDMAIGAKLKQNEHIAIGIGIGVSLTCLTFGISNKVRSRKIQKEIIEYDLDTNEVHIKKGNTEADIAFEEVSVSEPEVADKEIESEEVEVETEKVEQEESLLDRVNDILRKPQNLEDLKAVIKELRDNEKK